MSVQHFCLVGTLRIAAALLRKKNSNVSILYKQVFSASNGCGFSSFSSIFTCFLIHSFLEGHTDLPSFCLSRGSIQ